MNDKLKSALIAARDASTALREAMEALTGAFDGNEWTDDLRALFDAAHKQSDAAAEIEDWTHCLGLEK